MTRRERMERRADRRLDWAESRDAKAEDIAKQQAPFKGDIAFQTEPTAKAQHLRDKYFKREGRRFEHLNMAGHHRSKAAGIDHQLDTSIFSDDADAIARLDDRIIGLEAERAMIRKMNATLRKWRKGKDKHAMPTVDEIKAMDIDGPAYLKYVVQAQNVFPREYWEPRVPSYALSNLSGNIRRNRQRLEKLREQAA